MRVDLTGTQEAETATSERVRDSCYVWHPWSRNEGERERLMIVRGSGSRVWDSAGGEYFDAASLNSTCGYAHPAVVEAAREQMQTLHGIDMSATNHPVAGRLAELIASHLPPDLSRTLLLNSGSEGIEAALMIASWHSRHVGEQRRRVVTFARGYHGSTTLARSLSGLPPTSHPFDSPIEVTQVELPLPPAELKDPSAAPALVAAFAAAMDEAGAASPLAVLVEPMLNVGGGVLLPPGFLVGLRELCDRTGALLILDEVFTGYGRTGQMFAFQHEDMAPDILVSSKGLTGGYGPMSAVTARQEIYASFDRDDIIGGLRYGHTTGGHAVSCAIALATLGVIEREGLVDNARVRGGELLAQLTPLQAAPSVLDVRGAGLIVVIEMAEYDAATELVRACQDRGVMVRQQGNAVLVCPPLTLTSEEVLTIAERILAAGLSSDSLGSI